MGMAVVTPISAVFDALNTDAMLAERKKYDDIVTKRLSPIEGV